MIIITRLLLLSLLLLGIRSREPPRQESNAAASQGTAQVRVPRHASTAHGSGRDASTAHAAPKPPKPAKRILGSAGRVAGHRRRLDGGGSEVLALRSAGSGLLRGRGRCLVCYISCFAAYMCFFVYVCFSLVNLVLSVVVKPRPVSALHVGRTEKPANRRGKPAPDNQEPAWAESPDFPIRVLRVRGRRSIAQHAPAKYASRCRCGVHA